MQKNVAETLTNNNNNNNKSCVRNSLIHSSIGTETNRQTWASDKTTKKHSITLNDPSNVTENYGEHYVSKQITIKRTQKILVVLKMFIKIFI